MNSSLIISILSLLISLWVLYLNRKSFYLKTRPMVTPLNLIVERDEHNLEYSTVKISLKNFGEISGNISNVQMYVSRYSGGRRHIYPLDPSFSKYIIMPGQDITITGYVESRLCFVQPIRLHVEIKYKLDKPRLYNLLSPKYSGYYIYGNPNPIGKVIIKEIDMTTKEEWRLEYSNES